MALNTLALCALMLSLGQPPAAAQPGTLLPVPKMLPGLSPEPAAPAAARPADSGESGPLSVPQVELPDMRVRLVPRSDLESRPEFLVGKAEYGTTRPDMHISYRTEKRPITTMKPRTVVRRVEVLSRRHVRPGEVDPTTGEEASDSREVMVPVSVMMSCQVMEAVTEEVEVRVPEMRLVESAVVVRKYGLLLGENTRLTTRYRALILNDPLALPPCEIPPPGDPLGRPESPEGGAAQPTPSAPARPLPGKPLGRPGRPEGAEPPLAKP